MPSLITTDHARFLHFRKFDLGTPPNKPIQIETSTPKNSKYPSNFK